MKALLNSVAGDYGPDDVAWVQFVNDHLDVLIRTGTETIITPDEAKQYEYNFHAYHTSVGLSQSIVWITFLINDIVSEVDFISMESILLPNITTIKELYHSYQNEEKILS